VLWYAKQTHCRELEDAVQSSYVRVNVHANHLQKGLLVGGALDLTLRSNGLTPCIMGMVPQPHVTVKVVDKHGNTVQCGVVGELRVRGISVASSGYWGEPDKTVEAVDSHGWIQTGDLGLMDGHGFFNVLGRMDELIIRGGGACIACVLTF
jgi:acyl-CoA synthetase (AMP-forming)/AMP-acid ligase II